MQGISWLQRLQWGDPTPDLVIFFRSLATLQGAGIHIVRALEVLSVQLAHPAVKAALHDALRRVSSGSRLSSALAHHRPLFGPLQLQLLVAGENSGALHAVLGKLAEHAEKSQALHQRLRSAMVYPALITALCLTLLVILPGFVFRDLLRFLSELHVELPLATKLLLFLSKLVSSPVFLLALGGSLALACWAWSRLRTRPAFMEQVERLMLKVPGVGPTVNAAWVADFCRALACTYGAGVPLLNALEIAGRGRSLVLNGAIDVVRTQMSGGEQLWRCLSQTGLFPPLAVQLIRAGEDTGELGAMLERVADSCEELVDERLTLLSSMLQPLVLLAVGLVVGFMVIAVMSPMLRVLEAL